MLGKQFVSEEFVDSRCIHYILCPIKYVNYTFSCEWSGTLLKTNCSQLSDYFSCTAYPHCSWHRAIRSCHTTSHYNHIDIVSEVPEGTCESHDTCSTCNKEIQCYWYGYTCTLVDLLSEMITSARTCPLQCDKIKGNYTRAGNASHL